MSKKRITELILDSWNCRDGNVNSTADILAWLNELNRNTSVKIKETQTSENSFWFYDQTAGRIVNRSRGFFSVAGMKYFVDGSLRGEQPIIVQNEIGFLGIIVKEIDGVLNFLMQAKVEPGNVNGFQLSPTIQATKSNFTRVHGGLLPRYFEWFDKASQHGAILYDQIQSEQGNRFIGKRNRNIIIMIKDDIELHPNYKWMTLGQIKRLMKIDNVINMDTRTVLSGLPVVFSQEVSGENDGSFSDKALYRSIYGGDAEQVTAAFTMLNNYKMHKNIDKFYVPLHELSGWMLDECGCTCAHAADFDVRYYDIEIEGREVKSWMQPLFKARTQGLFVLFTRVEDGIRRFLISRCPEIGCFDEVEFGPSIQIANLDTCDKGDFLYKIYERHLKENRGIMNNVMLSEEGGRFYHEQNRNMVIEIAPDELRETPEGCLWVNYATLNILLRHNNLLNIQLRNLISLLDN